MSTLRLITGQDVKQYKLADKVSISDVRNDINTPSGEKTFLILSLANGGVLIIGRDIFLNSVIEIENEPSENNSDRGNSNLRPDKL